MATLFTNPYLATVALILGFGFLIFVHELGHFLVAKWVGIRATQFAIGFGHAVLSWRKGIGLKVGSTESEYRRRAQAKLEEQNLDPDSVTERKFYETADALGLGETEYRLNWMPLGGYVKMLGQEDMDPNAMSDDPRAFNRKSVSARAAVISAGVVMNIIFGLLFLVIAFSDFAGVEFAAPYVGYTIDDTPAATTYADGHDGDPDFLGLRPGDHITHVHGKPIEDMVAVKIAGALGDPGQPVPLTIQRRGLDGALTYNITPVADERAEGMLAMGIGLPSTLDLPERVDTEDWADTVWGQAGVQPGMSLLATNGRPLDIAAGLGEAVEASQGGPVTLTFGSRDQPDTGTVEVTLDPDAVFPKGPSDERALLGLLPTVSVPDFGDKSTAQAAGMQAGDVLAQVGDKLFPSVDQVVDEIEKAGRDGVHIEVMRNGERVALGVVKPKKGRLGIVLTHAVGSDLVRGVSADSPLADLELPPGSRVTSVNGEPVSSFNQLTRKLLAVAENATDQAAEVQLGFAVNLGDGRPETTTLALTPDVTAALADVKWQLPQSPPFEPLEVRVAGETLGEAASLGLAKTGEFVQQTYITLLRLIQGSVKPKNLRGPIGIVDAGVSVAARGWPYYLFFLGLISINLAVINFLPIPIVDGGLMVFLVIEKLRGKPAGPAIQTAAMIVGLVLIASVFLVVTFHDIVRLIT